MIKIKKWGIYLVLLLILAAVFVLKTRHKPSNEVTRQISPVRGSIQTVITSTATVLPQNRLEIKPPINGRIDQILVKEGDDIKAGQTLAWMSSTERAALLDAARAQGPDVVTYWETVYKPAPLMSPIDGEVIVCTDQPGQTITSQDAVMVLSDHLIVRAQVDETDIGKVALGQKAAISLDAYPQIKTSGKVDHIYYESTIVSNVTIYNVDILPEVVPPVFRSGMTATVNILEKSKDDILLIPLEAVTRNKDGASVILSQGALGKPVERKVELGISDEKNVEILSGLTEDDKILVKTQKYTPANAAKSGTNPLMPMMRRSSR